MKPSFPLSLALCLLASLPATAQGREDTVSIEEMAANFYRYIQDEALRDESRQLDIVLFGEKVAKGKVYIYGEDSNAGPAFCRIPALRQADGTQLPQSQYLWMTDHTAGKDSTGQGERNKLYWLKTVDGWEETNEELRQYLEARYGSEMIGDTLKLIPVRWYEGELACLGTPYTFYCYNFVSSRLHRGVVTNGAIRTDGGYDGMYYPTRGTLPSEASQIRSGAMNIAVTADGKYSHGLSQLRRKYGINLLAVKLNDALRRMGRTEEWEKKKTDREFALLLYMDRQHKTYLRPLLPREPDAIDRRLLADLAAALDEQPPGILPEFYALDGRRFAGVYLKARCVHGRWTLEDYIGSYHYEL